MAPSSKKEAHAMQKRNTKFHPIPPHSQDNTMSTEEQKPFLDSPSTTNKSIDEYDFHHTTPAKSRNGLLIISAITNATLLTICLLLSLTLLSLSHSNSLNTSTRGEIADPYSPANNIITHEYRSMIPNNTRFTGHPGAEWERAMGELMDGTLLRLTPAELQQFGSDSIPLADGGYAAGLGVAHSLHCVLNAD
ncbi:hypothetical protein BO71DRAFT_405746 [Aspergillus ellipticus CBS 707.79]|uniref:Uncharacterized protein n=1 Tax=Aspergillus ellipticus CBS 707.79 TaxID=1448320 RepID=A0A319DMZ0_9EURO|nr:hypothetical protein BO71DRAFT_405746 [Aspergillus ellipticus CBS 707.79]